MGLRGGAGAFSGVHGFAWVAWVRMGLQRFAAVCRGLQGSAGVCRGPHGREQCGTGNANSGARDREQQCDVDEGGVQRS